MAKTKQQPQERMTEDQLPTFNYAPSLRSIYIIVALVTLGCYANTFTGSFVHDDRMAIVENADVHPTRSAWIDMLSNDFWGTYIRLDIFSILVYWL